MKLRGAKSQGGNADRRDGPAAFSPLQELARKFNLKQKGKAMSVDTINGTQAAVAERTTAGGGDGRTKARRERLAARGPAEEVLPPQPRVVYRDPADMRTILQIVSTQIILVALLLLSVFGNFYMYLRRPDRIVVDRSSGRTLQINDRDYGETEAVQLGPDRLTDSDKKYVVGEFVKALYRIDPATRAGDLERALRMMVPVSAQKFSLYLRDQRLLERQRNESWQAVWTPQSIEIDAVNQYVARVIGKQEITRLDNGQAVEETKQLQLTVKLMADPRGRADQNLRSGFQVAAIDYKELN